MRRPRSGFTLIAVLLLTSLFLVMGIGFLSQRQGQQESVQSARFRLQAREIARAGLEDAYTKLAKRRDFPPVAGLVGEESFSYTEPVTDFSDTRIGEYTVNVSLEFSPAPYQLARITSVGRLGASAAPIAQVILHAEVDVAINRRAVGAPVPNPDRFRILYLREEPRFE
jgi:type II secretory pathway pseudopilin PulG